MTKVTVKPGNCGFSVVITAQKDKGMKITVSLQSECETVMNMLEDVSSLDMRSLFSNHMTNPVYRSASKHLQHPACPVPAAILKAAEVELGLCLPDDVTIRFGTGDKKTEGR